MRTLLTATAVLEAVAGLASIATLAVRTRRILRNCSFGPHIAGELEVLQGQAELDFQQW